MHFGTGLVLTCRNQMHCSTACWAMQYLLHKYTTQAEDQSIHCWRYLTLLFVLSHSSSTCKHLTMQLANLFKLSKVTASILSVYSLHSTQIGLSLVSVTYSACFMIKNDQKMVRQELSLINTVTIPSSYTCSEILFDSFHSIPAISVRLHVSATFPHPK